MSNTTTFSIKEALKFGFSKAIDHWKTFCLLTLAFAGIGMLMGLGIYFISLSLGAKVPFVAKNWISGQSVQSYRYILPWWGQILVALLVTPLSYLMAYATTNLSLKIYNGKEASVRSAFDIGLSNLLRIFVATIPRDWPNLLLSLIGSSIFYINFSHKLPQFLGLEGLQAAQALIYLIVVPLVLYFWSRYYFAGYTILDNPEKTVWEDIETNKNITRNNQLKLLFMMYLILQGVAIAMIAIFFGIFGLLVLLPLFAFGAIISGSLSLAQVHVYKQLIKAQSESA